MEKIEYTKMYRLENSHFWFLGKRIFVDSVLVRYKNRIKNILDLGSGTGGMTKYLEKYGKVHGVEKYNYAIKLARTRNLNITRGSIDNLKFRSDSFDLVTIFDVLYHKNVKDEGKVIKEARRVLKKRGLLLVTDSALDFLNSYHDIVTQGKKRYTASEMRTIIEKQGLKILKVSYIYFSLFPVIVFKRLVINELFGVSTSDVKPVSPLINSFLVLLLKCEAFILRYTSFPIGSSLIILAEKK